MARPPRSGFAIATAFLLLQLSACDAPAASTEARFLARQMAIDPPQLWLAEVIGQHGDVQGAAYVCADSRLRETFVRARAEVNGAACEDDSSVVVKPGLFAVRCEAEGRRYALNATTTGDATRDLRLDFALTSLDRDALAVRQARRFRRVGPCPAGWQIGDQAHAGQRP